MGIVVLYNMFACANIQMVGKIDTLRPCRGHWPCPNTNTGTIIHCAAIRKSNAEYVLRSSHPRKAGYCTLTQLYSYHICLTINLMQDLGRP